MEFLLVAAKSFRYMGPRWRSYQGHSGKGPALYDRDTDGSVNPSPLCDLAST